MIDKAELDPVFEAWYDHKMDPGDADLLRQHRATLDVLRARLEVLSGQHLDAADLRQALWPRFGRWMKDHNLPPPPRR